MAYFSYIFVFLKFYLKQLTYFFIKFDFSTPGIFLKISKTIYYQKQIKIQIRNQNNNSVKIQSNLIEECIGDWSIYKLENKQVADANFCRGVSAR